MKRLIPPTIRLSVLIFLATAAVAWADPYAFIPSYDNDLLVRIDTSNDSDNSSFDTVSLESGCGPRGVAVYTTTTAIYVLVTCRTANALAVVDASGTIMQMGGRYGSEDLNDPWGVAADPKGSYAYVANNGNDTVAVGQINNPDDWITLGDGPDEQFFHDPSGIAAVFDEDTYEEEGASIRKIYVANNGATNPNNMVTVIKQTGEDDFEFDYVSNYTGSQPVGVTASPDGRFVYVVNSGSGNVSVIDTDTDRQEDTITVGNTPWGVAVGAMGDYLYVTNSADNTVTVAATDTNDPEALATVGTTPYGIAAPKNGDFAYAVNHAGNVPIYKIWAPDSSGTNRSIQDSDIRSPFALGAFIGGKRPAAPTNFTAIAEDDNTVELTWDYSGSDNIEGFKIERRVLGDSRFILASRNVDKDDESYSDHELSPETTYEYRICAYSEAADSAYATLSDDEGVTTEDSEDFSWCFIGTLLGAKYFP